MGNTSNVIAAVKAARVAALKNKQAAIAKAAEQFDKEIAAFDAVLRTLGGAPPRKAPVKKAAPGKKALPGKPASAKKAPAKKAVPVKKAAPAKKKTAPKKSIPKPLDRLKEYSAKATNQQKIVFVLGEAKRFLHIGEIAEVIKKHEPSSNITDLKDRFGKHMSQFRKQGSIVSYEAGGKWYYGLPEFMEGGKAKKGHEHKEG